jgi:hypothetical protein
MTETDKKDSLSVQKLQFQFMQNLRIAHGNVGEACKMMQIGRDTYLQWLNDDANFRFDVMVLVEEIGDFVENALMKKIQDGDTQAIMFFCKTKLKHRGYQEDAKAATTGPSKTKINVMVNIPNQPSIQIEQNEETDS